MKGPEDHRHIPSVTALGALQAADANVQGGQGLARTWASGFTPLDTNLGGGFHAGDLALLAGSQGTGKTTAALQMARNVAADGGDAVYVCYEHTPAQLLERLVVMEAALVAGQSAPSQEEVRHRLARGGADLTTALGGLPGASQALASIEAYGKRLRLVGARGDMTDLDDIRRYASEGAEPRLVVVDYLQKVRVGGHADEDDRVSRIAAALKDLALELECPVLAVTAVDRSGLDARRVRARHLKGSVTLAYEADVILVLQDKYDVVARDHLMYDLTMAEDYRRWLVWSLEKNRHGSDHVDMEFRKRLAQCYVEPHGRIVEERLVDERIHLEAGG